ncbi:MAG: plasmid pRiA4b ORF-3 family protein [Myxococcales bacterium]
MPAKKTKKKPAAQKTTKRTPVEIHRIRATLVGIEPEITRVIEVANDATLEQLHDVLQAAFGWTNSHLHMFTVGDHRFSMPDPDNELECEDEANVTVAEFARLKGGPLLYEYDFGDSWEHELEVEKVGPPEPGATYPRCVDGARACPPEDCGGVGGYEHLLEGLADPEHEEHAEMKEWAGEYDPEAFDIDRINRELRRGGPPLVGPGR